MGRVASAMAKRMASAMAKRWQNDGKPDGKTMASRWQRQRHIQTRTNDRTVQAHVCSLDSEMSALTVP